MARILKEDGGSLLLESGGHLLNEVVVATTLDCAFLDAVSSLSAPVAVQVGPPQTVTVARIGASAVTERNFLDTDTAPSAASGGYTFGTRFTVNADGQITHLRYYHRACAAGLTHQLSLWTDGGSKVATVLDAHAGDGGYGWHEVALGTPYAVTAGQVFRASYTVSAQPYGYQANAAATMPLTRAQYVTPSQPGYFRSGAEAFPASTNGEWFYADVVFVSAATSDVYAPTVVLVGGVPTLQASLLDAGPAVYSATLVGGGATVLAVEFLDSARGVYAPSAVGFSAGQSLSLGLLTSTSSVYAPSASVGPVAASVGFLDAGRALSAPAAVAVGAGQSLSVPLLTSASVLSAPTAVRYSAPQGLTTPLLSTNPVVSEGSISSLWAQTVPFLVSSTGTFPPDIDRARRLAAPLLQTLPDVFPPAATDARSSIGDALLESTIKQEFWPAKNTNRRVWPLPYRR